LRFRREAEAVRRWRNPHQHRRAQAIGRQEMVADDRLRIAGVLRDHGPRNGAQAPSDSEGTAELRGRLNPHVI
jgi:hypothetical protein